jgi:hypothetical protein
MIYNNFTSSRKIDLVFDLLQILNIWKHGGPCSGS